MCLWAALLRLPTAPHHLIPPSLSHSSAPGGDSYAKGGTCAELVARSWSWGAADGRRGSSSDLICSYSSWTLFSSKIPLVRARFWRCCLNATIPVEEVCKSPRQKMSYFMSGWHSSTRSAVVQSEPCRNTASLGPHGYLVWGKCPTLCAPPGSWQGSGCESHASGMQEPAWRGWSAAAPGTVLPAAPHPSAEGHRPAGPHSSALTPCCTLTLCCCPERSSHPKSRPCLCQKPKAKIEGKYSSN